ncbi:50S ribosomal protein L18 [Candidatus Woesearchaeota archaeon]|nr:50S ribosomal protein L18 [Candidatus Woesearchaeota archaeon]
MAKGNTHTVPFRRRRTGQTDYKKRRLLIESGKPRLVVRKSLKNVTVQVVLYSPSGDIVKASVNSKQLDKFGLKTHAGNIPSAYLTGYAAGLRAKKAGVKEAVFDHGLTRSVTGSRLYAAVKGIIDAGVVVPCDESAFPAEDRLTGKHIEAYAAHLKKSDEELYKKRFSGYLAQKVEPSSISSQIATIKDKITAELK